jgi:hypothetical protein
MAESPESDSAGPLRPEGFSRRTLFAAGGVSAILGATVGGSGPTAAGHRGSVVCTCSTDPTPEQKSRVLAHRRRGR